MNDTACTDNPAAEHGFNRNASHTEDRYVCDCDGWSPNREMFNAIHEATRLLNVAAEGFQWDEESYENKVRELEAKVGRLEKAPDYQRAKKAKELADAEYVGQAWQPLWEWAWEQAALIQESDDES